MEEHVLIFNYFLWMNNISLGVMRHSLFTYPQKVSTDHRKSASAQFSK